MKKKPLNRKSPRKREAPRTAGPAAERLAWPAGNMLYPVPVVLVSCGVYGGPANLITVAWCGTVCTNPPMVTISVRPERHSYGLIRQTGMFGINLTTRKLAFAADWCGVVSGRDHDKFARLGLSPVRAEKITAPLVGESPVSLECAVRDVKELGSHHMFTAEVLGVQVDGRFHDPATGHFDLAAAEPLCWCHGGYYVLGKRAGTFGFSVRKRK